MVVPDAQDPGLLVQLLLNRSVTLSAVHRFAVHILELAQGHRLVAVFIEDLRISQRGYVDQTLPHPVIADQADLTEAVIGSGHHAVPHPVQHPLAVRIQVFHRSHAALVVHGGLLAVAALNGLTDHTFLVEIRLRGVVSLIGVPDPGISFRTGGQFARVVLPLDLRYLAVRLGRLRRHLGRTDGEDQRTAKHRDHDPGQSFHHPQFSFTCL